MGYCIEQTDSEFFILKEHLPKVFEAAMAQAKALADKGLKQLSWTRIGVLLQAKTLDEIFEEWRWELSYDSAGNVSGIDFTGEKLGEDLDFFKVIAPFVKAKSYIDMLGEDRVSWRYHFQKNTCIQK